MPRKTELKIVLMQLAVVVVLGGAAVFASPKQDKAAAQDKAAKPKITLHDQAKKAGGKLVMKYKGNRGTIYPNVEELARRSDLIVVGRVLSNKSNLSTDQKFITQDFLVKVHEVIKGDLARGRSVLVSLPGGRHRFQDGAYAAIMPVGFKLPEDKGIYVFFLKSKGKDSAFKGQRLVSERQAMFALTNGTVEPSELAADDPMNVKYRKMDAASFLREVHKGVPRKKK
jgi:hypothetical protein